MVMINDILLSVRNRIEATLQAAQSRDEEWIRLTNLTGLDGSVQPEIAGRIVMSLAALQHDTSLGAFPQARAGSGDSYGMSSAPQFIDAYVLFASCFVEASYAAGLAILSRIIEYLQEYPVFDAASSPDIGARMGNLAIELVGLDLSQASHLATFTGLKGQPFVLYRLRRLPFVGAAISSVAPAVQQAPPPLLQPQA
ncbi:Pvc16 family protein [Sphingomonas sp. LM7]|uniref:Pvc16 family protein n=1 Tax=Sphingomonas sp. LM7 TaxID=1938607 RepID=UPI000983DAF7|nr:Pvc16 family protein [Sphingomonas sp. LM7]AQR73688.1 hypothetical protein BXU08_08595 [Sphingomonas sp. LM7]